jgi:UDP-N-acetylglucosamine--N-acetylmuramyl-(pentapeptide) pyrophosphoryl-undecaprenol N-acetylglucosamine transferase
MSAAILLAGGGTGGHVFPLVAVADALARIAPEVEVVFVGTERGMEARVVPERGYRLELMDVLPLRGGGFRGALRGAVRAAGAVAEARELVQRVSPRAVLSIGGYAAGPVSLSARLRGLPLALLEPNSVIGLSNRLIAPLVHRAYTAFSGAERHFAKRAVRRMGVPIRAGFDAAPYDRSDGVLSVLVLGGSQGARRLNESVPEALCKARTAVCVVHQCGRADVEQVSERYLALGAAAVAQVTAFIHDMPAALREADLVIARSGASAVSEICAVGRPSILVPYPHAAGDHQRENAKELAQDGAAVWLSNADASPDAIAGLLDELCSEPGRLDSMALAARGRGLPNAATNIARDLLGLAGLLTTTQQGVDQEAGDDGSTGDERCEISSAAFAGVGGS